jgi:peroxiredoxin
MRPVAISVDAPESSRTLCQKAGDTSTLLADPHAGVMRRYDLVHAGAGIKGQDSARPGECWVDVSGTVRGVNLTDNSWVRARPDQMLAVAQALR